MTLYINPIVFSQLMMHTETNEENLTAYIKLLDNAMCHEVSYNKPENNKDHCGINSLTCHSLTSDH